MIAQFQDKPSHSMLDHLYARREVNRRGIWCPNLVPDAFQVVYPDNSAGDWTLKYSSYNFWEFTKNVSGTVRCWAPL